jgi:hypothetical protein
MPRIWKGMKVRTLSSTELALVSGGGGDDCTCDCGGGGGNPPVKGNNGWGNGEDAAPGNSLAHQPKFEDPNTGPSPSNSPASGGGDR